MELAPRTPVLVAARRTPIGTAGHAFKDVTVDALAAPAIEAAVADLPEGLAVDEVVLGNCLGPGGNVARVAALRAGLPDRTAARTVDLQCGSGLAAVVAAADSVRAGRCDVVVAGGAESASTAPTRRWPSGEEYSRAPFAPTGHPDPEMGPAADDLARHAGISRERADRYAARSFSVPDRPAVRSVRRRDRRSRRVGTDERVRDGLTVERLARLRPVRCRRVVTAATATGISDAPPPSPSSTRSCGAPRAAGWPCSTRRRRAATRRFGLGPVPAIRARLRISQLRDPEGGRLGRIDRVEINEAFAPQSSPAATRSASTRSGLP